MGKYKRCPYCHHKNEKDSVLCVNCNQVIDRKVKKKRNWWPLIIFIFSLLLALFIYYKVVPFIKNVEKKKLDDKKEYVVETVNFLDVINNIKVEEGYNENKLIPVKEGYGNNKYKLIDISGDIIYEGFSRYVQDCNNYHIVTKNINNKSFYLIIDKDGDEIYESEDRIIYYPKTNSWLIGSKLYHDGKLINSDIYINEENYYDGYYFSFNDKETSGIVDYNGNINYRGDKKDLFYLVTSYVNTDERVNYCLLNVNYKYVIINCNTGEELYTAKGSITQVNSNSFKTNSEVFYINYKGEAVKDLNNIDSNNVKIEFLKNKLIIIGNSLYDRDKYSYEVFSDKMRSYDNRYVEDNNNINKTYCFDYNSGNIQYGLRYKGKNVIDCNNDSITYFSNDVMKYLVDNNNLYAIVRNDNSVYIYDVYNNKILLNNVTGYYYDSIFVTYKDEGKKYIYNLNSNEKIEYTDDILVSLYSNYVVLEKFNKQLNVTKKEYYNSSYRHIYMGD